MIYVATVHWHSPKWIDIQQRYMALHIREPYTTYASFEGVPDYYRDRYDVVIDMVGPHSGKLNLLAEEIAAVAQPDDLMIFIDGDAFLVADPLPTIRAALETSDIVAVRRDENLGEIQPHPCFAAMRVATWEELHGDWSIAYQWIDSEGVPHSDPGANLLATMKRKGRTWTPLLRSNTRNDHPLWFGVYGGIVYHHGAGFRGPLSRLDVAIHRREEAAKGDRAHRLASVPIGRQLVARLEARRYARWEKGAVAENQRLSDYWFEQLSTDTEFYRLLIDA